MDYQFQWNVIWQNWRLFAEGIWLTIQISAVATVLGLLIGMSMAGLQLMKNRVISSVIQAYIEIIRNTPFLVQLFFVYFGLPTVGIRLPAFLSASIALILYSAAYLADIWRGSVESIPKAQWEAGTALGLSWLEQFRFVILPQAVKVSIPPTIGFAVQVIKNTSLTSIIGYVELTRQGQILNNVTFRPFAIFAMVGAIYFALCYPLSLYSKRLEAKLSVAAR